MKPASLTDALFYLAIGFLLAMAVLGLFHLVGENAQTLFSGGN